jgi:SAM-dependent methyltransferase
LHGAWGRPRLREFSGACAMINPSPSRLLDMRECESPESVSLSHDMSCLSLRLQPTWFRPLFRIARVRSRLGFDQWSRRWEYPWAAANAQLGRGTRALDAGSGGSPFPLYLAALGIKCYATDPGLHRARPSDTLRHRVASWLGISTAWHLSRSVVEGHRSVPVVYSTEPIQSMGFPDSFFHTVFCLSVMEHIPKADWGLCMKQLARVVKPGGRLLLTLDMSTSDADARVYEQLVAACPLELLGSVDYAVPITAEDKALRHPGYTYETVGLVWQKK